jgi:hypothetical protein
MALMCLSCSSDMGRPFERAFAVEMVQYCLQHCFDAVALFLHPPDAGVDLRIPGDAVCFVAVAHRGFPFERLLLQRACAATMFHHWVLPPRATGFTWSAVSRNSGSVASTGSMGRRHQ